VRFYSLTLFSSLIRADSTLVFRSPEDAQPRIDAVCLDLWRSSSLADMYDPLLERIVEASENPQTTQRTKALRAIGMVVAQDPDLFHQVRFIISFLFNVTLTLSRPSQDNFRRVIEARMIDSSPAVRDTAIELVGKYVVSRPDLAVQYLPQLSERIHVRRRSSPSPAPPSSY
jgi:cohesin loading factor subunit SCC2